MVCSVLLKNHFQDKILLLCFELIERLVLFAEGYDGAGSKSVTLFRAEGNAVFIKSDHTIKTVSYHQHQAGNGDGFDFNVPPIRFNLFAGVDGIFDGIGQHGCQFRFINRKDLRRAILTDKRIFFRLASWR